jgi:hypothetical protein
VHLKPEPDSPAGTALCFTHISRQTTKHTLPASGSDTQRFHCHDNKNNNKKKTKKKRKIKKIVNFSRTKLFWHIRIFITTKKQWQPW